MRIYPGNVGDDDIHTRHRQECTQVKPARANQQKTNGIGHHEYGRKDNFTDLRIGVVFCTKP